MLRDLRGRLSYANVMSTIAVFVALGGTTYAAATITGGDVKNKSLTGKDVKPNSLTGKQIAERRLGTVRRARNAALFGGRPPSRYLVRCPTGTTPLASVCVETQPRPPQPYSNAAAECDRVDRPQTPGRRLPTHDELMLALGYDPIQLAAGGELTRNVRNVGDNVPLEVITVVTVTGRTAVVPDTAAAGSRSFRCVASPIN